MFKQPRFIEIVYHEFHIGKILCELSYKNFVGRLHRMPRYLGLLIANHNSRHELRSLCRIDHVLSDSGLEVREVLFDFPLIGGMQLTLKGSNT